MTGVVTEEMGLESKRPNHAVRKCIKVKLINEKVVMAFVPFDGSFLNCYIQDEARLQKTKRRDIPSVKYEVVKVNNVTISEIFKGKVKPLVIH